MAFDGGGQQQQQKKFSLHITDHCTALHSFYDIIAGIANRGLSLHTLADIHIYSRGGGGGGGRVGSLMG